MARIAFLPLSEVGHVNATFRLARQLRERGHHVSYMAQVDMEKHVRAQGWDFVPLFEHLFPLGYSEGVNALLGSRAPAEEKRAALAEMRRRISAEASETLLGADFQARLRDSGAELLIIDEITPLPALVARKLGLRVLLLSTMLPTQPDPAVPPLSSALIPTGSALSRLEIRLLWQVTGWIRQSRFGHMRAPLEEFFRQNPALGSRRDIRGYLRLDPREKLPVLVASSPELDFPRAQREHIHYTGPGVDLDRVEPPLPPGLEKDGPPILYCALSSHGSRAAKFRSFLQAALDALAGKPEWRLVMAVGSTLNVADFRIPPNATVVSSAPQLAVLRRASLMMTAGGFNTVKECICLGVPMIVFPMFGDHQGNAARIVFHGLGVRGDIRKATPETISSRIDQVAADPGYRARIQAMQQVFLADNAAHRAVEVIERLSGPGRR